MLGCNLNKNLQSSESCSKPKLFLYPYVSLCNTKMNHVNMVFLYKFCVIPPILHFQFDSFCHFPTEYCADRFYSICLMLTFFEVLCSN